MAQADFDFQQYNVAGVTTLVGGPDGAAALHGVSELAVNPLSGNGVYARQFTYTGDLTTEITNEAHLIIGHMNDPTFIGVPSTKAISMRAWIRNESLGNDAQRYSADVGLSAKMWPPNLSAYTTPPYSLYLGSCRDDGLHVAYNLYLKKAAYYGGATTLYPCTSPYGSFAKDEWHHVRLDVVPLGGGVTDRVTAYVDTDRTGNGPENWVQAATYDVGQAEPQYLPWGSGSVSMGFFHHQGRYGPLPIGVWSSTNMYMDAYDVFLEGL